MIACAQRTRKLLIQETEVSTAAGGRWIRTQEDELTSPARSDQVKQRVISHLIAAQDESVEEKRAITSTATSTENANRSNTILRPSHSSTQARSELRLACRRLAEWQVNTRRPQCFDLCARGALLT